MLLDFRVDLASQLQGHRLSALFEGGAGKPKNKMILFLKQP